MTSAPHSDSTAPEIGTNVQLATSTTRMPASTSFIGPLTLLAVITAFTIYESEVSAATGP